MFVALNELETPSYHIVPSNIVANTIKNNHQAWLSCCGKNGQQHNDNNLRNFFDKKDQYLNRWDFFS